MWQHLLRTVVSGVLVAVVGTASTPGIDQDVPVVFVGLPTQHEEMARWAMGLFGDAGLDLPPMRYLFHGDDPSECRERRGLEHMIGGIAVVEICTSAVSFPTQYMYLHETAHAWADHALTADRMTAFQELRGWEHWRNYSAAVWYQNGTEQAAEILVWGLVERPIRLATIDYDNCDELESGYIILTGVDPLHGYRDKCDGW